MKKILLTITLLISSYSFAHCPSKISYEGDTYCADLKWQNTERKVRGLFVETDKLSPVLIPMREVTPEWEYSTALISVWKKADRDHVPVFLNGLRFFPYMNMVSGHHHSGAYELMLTNEDYVLSQMAFHQMPGCWSVRWTFNVEDGMSDSAVLSKVMSYENVDDNTEIIELCMAEGGDGGQGGHESH